MRLIQILDQHKCSGDHQHEPAMGGNAAHTAYYTPEMASKILEALYPNKFYGSVPSVQHGSAFVTLNLSRSQWLNDERGVQAVQKEADGPRANETWDGETVDTLQNWKTWARNSTEFQHQDSCRGPFNPLRNKALRVGTFAMEI